eukprot:2241605-Rhodomonas_salina.2
MTSFRICYHVEAVASAGLALLSMTAADWKCSREVLLEAWSDAQQNELAGVVCEQGLRARWS